MSLEAQFRVACERLCREKVHQESHCEIIVRNVMNDPRTRALLETLRESEVENDAGTAVIGEAVYYFAKGAGSEDLTAAAEFKKRINPIQRQNRLAKELTARKKMNGGQEGKKNGRTYATSMVRCHSARGHHRVGKQSPGDFS